MKKITLAEIKEYFADDLTKINELLSSSVANNTKITTSIAQNIFSGGGKRIRPIIALLIARLFNYNDQKIFYLATAVELIHTSTLLHDDVIDESNLRRNKQTANAIYGNKASILVGDVLFAESFKYMVKTKSLDVLYILAKASAIIAEGEVKQLEIKGQSFQEEDYFKIINAKTAELFGATTKASSTLAGATQEEINNLEQLGLNLGIAFQIIDDLLDYQKNSQSLGKNIGDDFFEQKITLPIILLYKTSNKKEKIKNFFQKTQPTKIDLDYILLKLKKKKILTKCINIAKQYIDKSLKILESFPDNKEKDILKAICYITIDRKN